MSLALGRPRRILQGAPKYTRDLAKSSSGGDVFAFGDMIDRTSLLRAFCPPLTDGSPGMIGFEDCGGPFTHLRSEKTIAGRFLVRLFLGTERALSNNEFDNVNWLRGIENPADCLAKVKSEMAPLRRMLQAGSLRPAALRPLAEVSPREDGSGR